MEGLFFWIILSSNCLAIFILVKSTKYITCNNSNPPVMWTCIQYYNDCSDLNLFGKILFKIIFILPLIYIGVITIIPYNIFKFIKFCAIYIFYKRGK